MFNNHRQHRLKLVHIFQHPRNQGKSSISLTFLKLSPLVHGFKFLIRLKDCP